MSIDSEAMVWFLMRAAYGQEQKAQEFLEAKGCLVLEKVDTV